MTNEQLRQNAAAMLAFADGKPIQFSDIGGDFKWEDNSKPGWKFGEFQYRPKPEPATRPWSKPEDVPGPVCWIRPIKFAKVQTQMLITGISNQDICLSKKGVMTWESLIGFEHSTDRKTWQKCEVCEATE